MSATEKRRPAASRASQSDALPPSRRRIAVGMALTAAIAMGAIASTIAGPALAADDPQWQRLATCQDSWLDWKGDDARLSRYADDLRRRLKEGDGGSFTPRSAISALGMSVSQVFPQSVGMGLGFSLIVDGDFASARRSFEQQLGHAMTCESGDGTQSCEYKIAAQKTAVLMVEGKGRSRTTLVGCYYLYQQ